MILAFEALKLLITNFRKSSLNSPARAEQNAYLRVGDGALVDEFRARMIYVVACREMVVADWYEREAVWRAWQLNEAGQPTPANAMTAAKGPRVLVGTASAESSLCMLSISLPGHGPAGPPQQDALELFLPTPRCFPQSKSPLHNYHHTSSITHFHPP